MPRIRRLTKHITVVAILAIIAATVAVLVSGIAIDDSFVTYRYARNLAQGYGFVYNRGEPVLSTTAPFYALLLALLSHVSDALPRIGYSLSLVSLFAAALLIYLICARFERPLAGAVAAILLIPTPLALAAIGLETWFYLTLILLGFYLYFTEHINLASLALALAIVTRADALIPTAVILTHYILTKRSLPWPPIALGTALTVSFFAYLTLIFGSPVPLTLTAKMAQLQVGWPDYVQGLAHWVQRYFQQSPLYALILLLAILGLTSLPKQGGWLSLLLGWAVLHALAYQLLSVASYDWYYTPLLPAAATLAGLGLDQAIRIGDASWPQLQRGLPITKTTLAGLFVLPLIYVQFASLMALHNSLPDPKAKIYREVGLWLRQNTPKEATIGVMEVGIMGYYAERRMIDFLGLLRPGTTAALKRNDIFWTIAHYEPDYLVLTGLNPLWGHSLKNDEWFEATYLPIQQFVKKGYDGNPITVYRRLSQPRGVMEESETALDFAHKLKLVAYAIDHPRAEPGEFLTVRLDWQKIGRVDKNYAVFVHLVNPRGRLLSQQDIRTTTSLWPEDKPVSYYHHLKIPKVPPASSYRLVVGVYDPATLERLPILDAAGVASGTSATLQTITIGDIEHLADKIQHHLEANFGDQIDLLGYDLDRPVVSPGEKMRLTIYWQAHQPLKKNYKVFAHLLDDTGHIVAQHDSEPQNNDYPTSLWKVGELVPDRHEIAIGPTLPPGYYVLEFGLYLPASVERLPVTKRYGQEATDSRVLIEGIRITAK
ncbi:MAG: hypothetical protein M1136_10425 [Chloroflexi bacterium]|nr:hypothetical protein [Chloroflexota bacterium]MCL5076045.1 hypothetical protein [Chloroflexota bacterium]